jgi:phosphoglycolate phosphatase
MIPAALLKVEAVLFDLDGTIIDSYPGIQKAFDNAFLKLYSVENEKSVKPFIGPPIPQILTKVNGETDPQTIDLFVKLFKECYDTEDFKSSVLYNGIKELLKNLCKKGSKLFIVTNKRQKPTELIIKYLEIDPYFCDFYCSDSKKGYTTKTEMVNHLIEYEGLSRKKCVLIGDTYQDQIAAQQNELYFIYAAYGYETLEGIETKIFEPLETLNFIN